MRAWPEEVHHSSSPVRSTRLFLSAFMVDFEGLEVKYEVGVLGDVRWGTLGSVGEFGGNDDATFGAGLQTLDTNVHAWDDFTGPDFETKRLAGLVLVKHLAIVLELADVARLI